MRIHKAYLLATVLLFVIEVLIALFVKDRLIRPYGGDFLVVILVYCFVKSFVTIRPLPAAIGSLLFAYLIEYLQYLHFVDRLGLQHNQVARVVLGTGFAWGDMLAYTLGIGLVIIMEQLLGDKTIIAK